MSKSKSITIELSTLCDASCIICPRDKYKYKFKSMDFDMFKMAVDKAYSAGYTIISLGGYGDPFMSKDIEKCLKYIKTTYPSLLIQASSTCNCLTGRIDLLKYVDILRISMYGITKETYEKIHRGYTSFKKAMKNISDILEMTDRPYVSMNFVVIPENESELEQWKAYWEPKVDEIQVWKPHNWTGLFDSNEDCTNKKKVMCFRPFSDEYDIRVNGDISACCWDINHDLIIGDIQNDKLEDLYNSDKVQNLQNTLRTYISGGGGSILCTKCDQCTDRSDALIYSSNKNIKSGRKNYLTER